MSMSPMHCQMPSTSFQNEIYVCSALALPYDIWSMIETISIPNEVCSETSQETLRSQSPNCNSKCESL